VNCILREKYLRSKELKKPRTYQAKKMGIQGFNNGGDAELCDCGCGLYFCGSESMGFQIKIGECLIMEKQLYKDRWSNHLHLENVHTWSELKTLFMQMNNADRNSKIWMHLHAYTQINVYEYNILPDSRVSIDLLR